jgi:hypothetical protein
LNSVHLISLAKTAPRLWKTVLKRQGSLVRPAENCFEEIGRPWKDHFKSDLRSDQEDHPKNDLRSLKKII